MSKTISSIVETKVKLTGQQKEYNNWQRSRKKSQTTAKCTTGSAAEVKSNNPFLHHNQLSVLTPTRYSFHAHVTKAACQRSWPFCQSAGGRTQLYTHAPYVSGSKLSDTVNCAQSLHWDSRSFSWHHVTAKQCCNYFCGYSKRDV